MARNDANQPLLQSGLDDESTPPTNNRRRRRRLCRSRSAPHVAAPFTNDTNPPEFCINKPKTNFRKEAKFLFGYLVVGTICFYSVRSQIKGVSTNGILDGITGSVYFCTLTMTTIGYGGDLRPDTALSKLLVCAFVFTGMALAGSMILSKAVEYVGEKQDMLLVKALDTYQTVDLNHILKEIETETNVARHKCIRGLMGVLLYILLGTVLQVTVGKMDVVDAFYCVFATITTLGCGDRIFSATGRDPSLDALWILFSTMALAMLFLYAAEFHNGRRLRATVKWALSQKMSLEDLEASLGSAPSWPYMR